MSVTARSIIWVDQQGHTRQTIVKGNASLATAQSALRAQSNADYQNYWEGTDTVNGAPGPSFGSYPSVGDYAQLVFTDAAGNLVYITLPAPVATIFLADQETVDITQITAIIAAVVGTVVTSAGGVVTAFVGGIRRRRGLEYQ